MLLKKMLEEKRISAIIPGVSIPEHLDENAKASQARDAPKSEEVGQAIRDCTANFYANLTPEHEWLRRWGSV